MCQFLPRRRRGLNEPELPATPPESDRPGSRPVACAGTSGACRRRGACLIATLCGAAGYFSPRARQHFVDLEHRAARRSPTMKKRVTWLTLTKAVSAPQAQRDQAHLHQAARREGEQKLGEGAGR